MRVNEKAGMFHLEGNNAFMILCLNVLQTILLLLIAATGTVDSLNKALVIGGEYASSGTTANTSHRRGA